MSSRWPGLNGRPTVYEGEFSHDNLANFFDLSASTTDPQVDPHAPSRILAHEPDRVALGLLEAQHGWVATGDRVRLRRALLGLLASLDE
jgi:hypothetical protein